MTKSQTMDSLQTTITSLAVIAIVVIMVVFVCHYLGPRATAWVRSNREEKIGLSKSKIFNANGYMIHSGSDFLLSSSGSFKRFDSIDRDYKQVGQSSLTSPAWNIPQTDIPPQPLRPAPAPSQISPKPRETIEKPPKQKSFDSAQISTIIPRPVAKRQLSTPTKMNSNSDKTINLSEAADKIRNCTRANTNPFLNGTLESLPENVDNLPNCDTNIKPQMNGDARTFGSSYTTTSRNPFTADCLHTLEENRSSDPGWEAPQTDIDRRKIFDFEPEKINSILRDEKQSKKRDEEDLVDVQQHLPRQESTEGGNNKFLDSPCADAFENIEKMLKRHYRNRSFSETEATEPDLQKMSKSSDYYKSSSTNPFVDRNSIHKTISEDYLGKCSNQTWTFGRSLSRQESSTSLGRRNSSQSSLDGDKGSTDSINLQRAISCDSVSSESSVVLADLEQPVPPVTGHLCVGLQYDKNSISDVGVELVVTVMEAKELIGPPNVESFDTFVRIYLVPDEIGAMQTKLFKNSSSPSYNETFCFWLNKKRGRHSLWFHLYHSGSAHTLIGEAEMQICDVTRPITTWLALSDSRHNSANWGELMFSLSYLPTAERLTVVVVKARNLKLDQDGREAIDLQNIFVKVYLLKNDRKVSKKKTSLKRTDRCPIFNESMIFSIPPYVLNSIQVRLTVMSISETEMVPIGHVIVGNSTSGKSLRHWHQMLSSLRKPVAMWHALRRTATKVKIDVT